VPEPDELPFATPTIARLYMLQGKLGEAEAIYRALAEESPDDPRVRDGLAEVQRRRQAPAADSARGSDLGCRVELRAAAGGTLECSYAVSEAGRRRASLVLGEAGTLTLRAVAFPAAEQEDLELPGAQGVLALPARFAAAPVVVAAIGLRDGGGRFVAIAHGSLGSR
jgi:hypothetical protein